MRGKRRQQRRLAEANAVRPRRSAASRVFLSLFLLLVVGMAGAASLGYVGYSRFVAEGPLDQTRVFEVGKGLGTPEIAAALKQDGIIADEQVFAVAALLTGSRGRLKAGEYEFPARASIRDVMNIIASGRAILHKLTIPEGWTSEMVLNRVREDNVLVGELTLNPGEGEMLPETYLFKRGKTRDELVTEIMEAQSKLLDELWTTRGSSIAVKSAREAVILASIVEKETSVAEERPLVAAVFSNRLKKSMRLQSDPTIIYGIAGGKGKLDRPLSKADIAAKTPYNTYQIAGLPPGPIANPGRQAIEAVLNPASSKALYFVADGTGGHAFAETLAEHNLNVQKWRGVERNKNIIEAQPEAPADQPSDAPAGAAVAQPAAQSQMPDMNAVTVESKAQENAAAAGEADAEAPAKPDSAVPALSEPGAATEAASGGAPADVDPQKGEPTSSVQSEPASAANPAVEETDAYRKPGEVLKVADRLVPIPMPKPKRP